MDKLSPQAAYLKNLRRSLVGAVEKGFEKARLSRVRVATNIDLTALPNAVAYRAALIREKIFLQHVCGVLVLVLIISYALGRIEIAGLTEKLRTKEFILAPGVSDFIPASPQTVSDAYVQHAVSDFVSTLGNTNPVNIEERYRQLATAMSPALQIKFSAEAGAWLSKVKAENIAEMVTILEKEVESDGEGHYRATVHTRTDTFVGSETIGYRNEVIELELRLVAPDIGRRWYLEMTALSRTSADAFGASKSLGGSINGK